MAQRGCQTPRQAGNRTRLFSAACGVNTYGYCVCGAKDCNVASSRWILSFHSAQKALVTASASTASMRFLTCAKTEYIRCAVCKYTHQLSRILFRDAKAAKKVREGTDDVLYSQIPLRLLMGKNQNPCCPILPATGVSGWELGEFQAIS